MEKHRFISPDKSILTNPRIILGSFPTWTVALPDSTAKKIKRTQNNDLLFFYGSSRNQLWKWYKNYVDKRVEIDQIDSIKSSLRDNNIGLSDMILSCERKNKSAADSDLTCRVYNDHFFLLPKKGETLKILCTSKGVLNTMLLRPEFFSIHSNIELNQKHSDELQEIWLKEINGDAGLINKPFLRVLQVKNGGVLHCIALPSPGSPYRGLKHFGFYSGDPKKYLDEYLKKAFTLFLK
ncbi:MAG: hypothetical protein R3277_13490 [Brumimicrobium sp.]|nr:hypothetical protein [Brumimicrobium sp.]